MSAKNKEIKLLKKKKAAKKPRINARFPWEKEYPEGHVAHMMAEEAIQKEYVESRAMEDLFWKKNKKLQKRMVRMKAEYLASTVCQMLGIPSPKVVVKPDYFSMVAGYYDRYTATIVLLYPSAPVFVHELAHHVESYLGKCDRHGKNFIEAETLCFESLKEWSRNNPEETLN